MKSVLVPLIGVALTLSFAVPAARAQVSCSGVPAWADCCGCTYAAGQQVTYNGSSLNRYHASQTFTNTCGAGWSPVAVPSLWTLDGPCSGTAAAPVIAGHVGCPQGWSVSWNAVAGAVSYNVKTSKTSGGPYTLYASVTTTSVGNASPMTDYFVVTAVNSGGEGPMSNEVFVDFFDCAAPTPTPTPTPSTGAPSAPTGLSVVWQCPSGNTFTWNAVPGATSYSLKTSTTSGGSYTAWISNLTTNSYTTATGIIMNNYAIVTASNAFGESPVSNQVKVPLADCPTPTTTPTKTAVTATATKTNTPTATAGATPPPPSGLTAIASCSGTSVSLSWNGVGNAQSYNAKASSVSGGPYTTVGTGITATTFSTTNRGPFYVVSGVNVWGEGPSSAQAQLLLPPCPTPTPSPSATPRRTATNTATATATATARMTATASGICSGVPAFASCTAYGSGAKVVFNNALYHSIAPIPSTRDCPPSSPYNPSSDNWWVNDGGC